MKKTIVLLAAVALMASCTKVLDKFSTFNFSRTGEFTVPATSTLNVPIVLSTQTITSSYITEFENNGFSTDDVEHIKLSNMKVRIKTPSGTTFNFLKSVEIKISAAGLSDKVIAYKADVPNDNVSEMDIDVISDDIKPYLMQAEFKMIATSVIDEVITQDYVIEATPTFEVKGNLLK